MRDLPVLGIHGTIREALSVIDEGAAEIAFVVDQEDRVLGTVTDGDIRRGLLRGLSLDATVDDVVNRNYFAVAPQTPRAEVLDLMRARTLAQIPILDDEYHLVGLHLLREILGTEPRPNWAVVMAGGRGERLRPITDSIPKPMIQVAGRPILERIVLHLVGSGITKVFLAVNYMSEVIEDHFLDGTGLGCQIEYLREDSPLGTGGALSLLAEQPIDPLIILNGDLLTQVDLTSMLRFHEQGRFEATVGLRDYVHRIPFGVVRTDRDRVSDIQEKPSQVWNVNCGIYVIQPGLISRIPRAEYSDMTDLITGCLGRGEAVGGYLVEGDWIDVGRRSDLHRARGEGKSNE